MIIRGNFLYTPSPDQIVSRENAFLVIENGKVKNIYDILPEKYAGRTITDYGQALIIPAFNDLHIHAPQLINRGIGFDKELLPWLETYTFPVEGKYADLSFADRSYRLFINKLWAFGTMRFCAFATIHKNSTWQLMRLTEQSGLRAFIGKVNMDRNSPDYLCEDTDTSLDETEELIVKSKEELKHVRYILTPRFVPATTEKMMEGLGKLGEKYNLPVQSHLSENRSEVEWVRSLHPDISSYTEVYNEYGLLRENQTVMAHSIWLSDKEKELLKAKNIMLAHCAQSNANLSSGIMPIRENLKKGMRCCIASDVAGGHAPNMNKHIVASIETSKLYWLSHPNEKPLTLAESLYLSTKKSGEFFGKTGSFEQGYDFDALVIETDEMDGMFPRTPFEKLEQFIYDGDDRNIIDRYCCGEKIDRPFDLKNT